MRLGSLQRASQVNICLELLQPILQTALGTERRKSCPELGYPRDSDESCPHAHDHLACFRTCTHAMIKCSDLLD
eukprot:CAMPEP_0182806692 /NCGR_PEP_ID=MMETSP0006_2-20121128/5735_1 /TAXON_ID=97485 /ORGANISM="Prymnesium parvum, Strain Texoma1" /LENGTH=73 /DNA_ID=CAMNT_0024932325 /DNA_START=271 /DNA_END=492 /DNA_ORIENTATION=+